MDWNEAGELRINAAIDIYIICGECGHAMESKLEKGNKGDIDIKVLPCPNCKGR